MGKYAGQNTLLKVITNGHIKRAQCFRKTASLQFFRHDYDLQTSRKSKSEPIWHWQEESGSHYADDFRSILPFHSYLPSRTTQCLKDTTDHPAFPFQTRSLRPSRSSLFYFFHRKPASINRGGQKHKVNKEYFGDE